MLNDLHLEHFRSYIDESFEFIPGVNIIVGPNASGKTNLLEAILVLCRGKSYRVKDSELIQFNQDWSRLDAHLDNGSIRTMKLQNEGLPSKIFEIAGKEYKRLSLNYTLPVVLFEPNNLQLLSGGPERRREYLDDLLEQTTTGYGSIRRQYKRFLSQRNALLKHPAGSNPAQMFPWNFRLSELAGQIVRLRQNLAHELDKDLEKLYKELSQTATEVSLEYQNRWPGETYETNMLKALETNINNDKEKGFTSVGPHREDMMISFEGHPSPETASRGEVRTVVLALKITELELIKNNRGTPPILLLDDVFSELDGKRRHALTDYLSSYQTFITTTDADLVSKNFTTAANIVPISK